MLSNHAPSDVGTVRPQTRPTTTTEISRADSSSPGSSLSQASDARGQQSLGEFPPELLTKIFAAVVDKELRRRGHGRRSLALRLTWVCSRWRGIVLDTPHLWSRIQLNLDSRPSLVVLEHYLTRSKQAPLSLAITSYGVHQRGDLWTPFLNILIPEAYRWEHVVFHIAEWGFQFALAPIKGHLHSLKSLTLSFLNTDGRILDVYEGAPQLTMVDVSGLGRPECIMLPWPQLRECYLYEISTALHVLQVSRNLVFCRLSWIWVRHSLPPMDRIYNSSLKTLEITPHTSLDDDLGCRHFVSLLTLPSLQTLKCAPIRQPVDSALWQSFFPFLQRSARLLTNLTLRRLPFSLAELLECLELAPCLRYLNLKYDYENEYFAFDNEFMHRLDANRPGCLAPLLTSLSIHGPAVFDETSVAGMVTSRRHISSHNMVEIALLEYLVLGCSSPSSTSDPLPSLDCFVSEGLKVTYKHSWGSGA
ncbi:hypothetical protein BD779DRAFT_156718 [Infundibulicybe gibba]|nr:hypothetical protein BD779DRAFT_156718 [Infundibulicybe gibba]